MQETLERLEHKRASLYKRLMQLGDFRRGIISINYRKCGKKNCACAKEGHPGHGPRYMWNTTIKGKSYAKTVRLGPEMEKYLKEISNYHEFLNLSEEIVQVNEKICDTRAVVEIHDEAELERLKKNSLKLFMKKYKKK